MRQFLLCDNAVKLIDTMRSNYGAVKADICNAFADTVFQATSGNDRNAYWRTLTALQEYTHLVDCLTKTDNELQANEKY